MTKSRALAAVATTLLLGLTACSGGGGAAGPSEDDQKAADAISSSIMKEQKSAGADVFSMKQEEADCIGEGFVDEIGTEKLQKYGFLTKDLEANESLTTVKMSTADAEAAADTLFDCADVQQMMLGSMGDLDAKTKKCIQGVMTEDALHGLFVKMFSGKQEEAGQELIAPMMKCTTGAQQ
jgi:hypothetical protein